MHGPIILKVGGHVASVQLNPIDCGVIGSMAEVTVQPKWGGCREGIIVSQTSLVYRTVS